MASPSSVQEWITETEWRPAVGIGVTFPLEATLTEAHGSAWRGTYRRPEGGQVVISVESDPPPWVLPTLKRLGELLELEPNWDTYGACLINPDHAVAAFNLLELVMRDDTPEPTVVPTNRGGVQLEWHTCGVDLEIETLSTHRFLVAFEDSAVREEKEWELTTDLTPLVACMAKLSRPPQA